MTNKTPIWVIQEKQLCRVLRPSEAKTLISHVNAKLPKSVPFSSQVRFVATSTVQKWLYALLFTGMRPIELFKAHERPDLLKPEGFIHLDKARAWDKEKKKQIYRERDVYLSDVGIKIFQDFLTAPIISDDFDNLRSYLDHVLYQAAENAGFEKRTYPYRQKVRYFEFPDKTRFQTTTRKAKHVPEGATLVVEKIEAVREGATGIMLRSLGKTWESWLINSFYSDPDKLRGFEGSTGHSVQSAMKHYLTFQFDEEDMAEIRRATAGWGSNMKSKLLLVKEGF